MDRRSFGSKGAELSDFDLFVKALAITGLYHALPGAGPIPDDPAAVADRIAKSLEGPDEPLRCRYFAGAAHRTGRLAESWDLLKPFISSRPQFEVVLDDLQGAGWILDYLRSPILNSCSVYLGEQPGARSVDWQWPMRVGLLTDDARNTYAAASGDFHIHNLTTAVDVVRDRGTVDLLWITGDGGIEEAVRSIENAPYPIHAHAVAVVGSGAADLSTIERAKIRIAELTQAQMVSFITDVPPTKWLKSLVYELSHDQFLNVAVSAAGGSVRPVTSGPLLWASRPLIHASRISNFSRTLIEPGRWKIDPGQPLTLDHRTTNALMLNGQVQPAKVVIDRLRERIRDIGFMHESDGATVTADVNRALQHAARYPVAPSLESVADEQPSFGEELESLSPPKSPRHLQIAIYRESDPGQVTVFAPGKTHSLDVHIGPARRDRLVLPELFPEEKLPPTDSGGHLLTVVFFEPQAMEQPRLKTMFLPLTGPSNPCRFEFDVPHNASQIEGRVTVLHENRVLQTGIVQGPVTSGGDAGASHIEFVLSGVVRRAVADLDQRSRFDAALVLNHAGERPGMQGTAGNQPGYCWLDDSSIQEAKNDIDKALDSGDWDYAEYNGLHAEGTTRLLRLLAFKGNRLYTYISSNLPAGVKTARRLQVVIAKDHARFPVEFLYEFNPPGRNAPVCPHAAEALRTGVCSHDCKATQETPAPVVCPLGFWGMSRVIEWHAFTQAKALQLPANATAELDVDIAPTFGQVPLAGPILFAYSKEIDKADKDCVGNFKTRVEAMPRSMVPVESWPAWKTAVEQHDPSLLLLLVHTKKDDYGTLLEMGPPSVVAAEADWLLGTDYLGREYVFGPHISGTPIVLLLGCTTNKAKLPFDTVAAAFEKRANAGIIVSTSNLIYGPKAVEVAEIFLRKLFEVRSGETFGDVMLNVRRSALADGIAMILCISSYGDADWKLVL